MVKMVFTLKAMKTIVSKAPRYQYVLTLSKYYKKAALTHIFFQKLLVKTTLFNRMLYKKSLYMTKKRMVECNG